MVDEADMHRPRKAYLLLIAIIIPIGLVARHIRSAHPSFLSECTGDTLWPVVFFLAIGVAMPRAATWLVASLTLGITAGIEFSQLIHGRWLDTARSVPGLGFMLGNTFLWSDVACIVTGTLLAAICEWPWRYRRAGSDRDESR